MPPAHLIPHPDEMQKPRRPLTLEEAWRVADWIEQHGAWGGSMLLDERFVSCPACKKGVYESQTGQHARKCLGAQEAAGVNTQEETTR